MGSNEIDLGYVPFLGVVTLRVSRNRLGDS